VDRRVALREQRNLVLVAHRLLRSCDTEGEASRVNGSLPIRFRKWAGPKKGRENSHAATTSLPGTGMRFGSRGAFLRAGLEYLRG
jgi:hypothetical protein